MSKTPEPNPGALVASGPKALAVANRQARIAGQALTRIEQERYIEFFATHPEASRAFVEAVSRYYPCSESLIERYAEAWNWEKLSWNEAMSWSAALIKRYVEFWDWYCLSGNRALPWSQYLVDHNAERWHWYRLSGNEALPWSEDLIDHNCQQWDWDYLSANEALPWGDELIGWYSDQWNWVLLSRNKRLPWSEVLLDHFAERWDWESLCDNEAVPWTGDLIDRYSDRPGWHYPSRNEALPWSEERIERCAGSVNWEWLSKNHDLPWTEAFIERYAERWDWRVLSWNEALPWSEAFVERYAELWRWGALSSNEALPWTKALIERYTESWDWGVLSSNPALPWSEELIECYAAKWQWGWQSGQGTVREDAIPEEDCGLSGNLALPWSEALIIRYADRWDWMYIPAAALSTILPHWPEASIRAVMDRIVSKSSSNRAGRAGCFGLSLSSYETARPMFVEAMRLYAEGGREFAEWVKYLIEQAGVGVMPAVRRFTTEVRAGDVHVPGVNDEEFQAAQQAVEKAAAVTEVKTEPTAEANALRLDSEAPATAGGEQQAETEPPTKWVAELGVGPAFDEETYAKAKPHFQALLREAEAAGRDLPDFIRTVLACFGTGAKPYIIRFANDLRYEQAAVATVQRESFVPLVVQQVL